MGAREASRPPGWSRRRLLGAAAAAVGGWGVGAIQRAWGAPESRHLRADDPDLLPPFERQHLPILQLPVVASNGAKVPVVVEMTHPMDPAHYITRVQVTNDRDPVPSKGIFHLTPANGQVYLSFQARMDSGMSEVSVTAECTVHGRWSSTRSIHIPPGGGGCADPAPLPSRARDDDIRPPAIRIPQLLKRGRIRPGEVVLIQLVTRHPNRTGLAFRVGKFVQESEPSFLTQIEVLYGGERVSCFEGSPALSDDPFIGFPLRAQRAGLLRALFTDNRGQRFEATHEIRFG